MLKAIELRQKLNERLHQGKAQRADKHIFDTFCQFTSDSIYDLRLTQFTIGSIYD